MRVLLFACGAFLSLGVFAGERCIAIDGDTLVCNHRKVRLANVYAAELNQPRDQVRYSGAITSAKGPKLLLAATAMRLYRFRQLKVDPERGMRTRRSHRREADP